MIHCSPSLQSVVVSPDPELQPLSSPLQSLPRPHCIDSLQSVVATLAFTITVPLFQDAETLYYNVLAQALALPPEGRRRLVEDLQSSLEVRER